MNYQKLMNWELDVYIWHSYFNLAHSFKDKFIGAQTAVKELILFSKNSTPMRFVFNHYIHYYKDQNRIDSEFHSRVHEQIQIMSDDLRKHFLEYLKNNYLNYFISSTRERPNWITNLFLYSFARNCQKEYLEELKKNLNNPHFLSFIIKSNFLMWSSEKEPGTLRLDTKDVFFPEPYFQKMINSLKNMKKGVLNEIDQNIVEFFLEKIKR